MPNNQRCKDWRLLRNVNKKKSYFINILVKKIASVQDLQRTTEIPP